MHACMHAGIFNACKITHLLTATSTTDLTGRHTSQFANNTSSIKAFRKENPYWPLEKCSDMVCIIHFMLRLTDMYC